VGEVGVASVWDFAGVSRPVTVALLDDGLRYHEDLPASRILEGVDFLYGAFPVNEPNNSHALALAGIIAASHTTDSIAGTSPNSGVISMNPNALIRPVRIIDWNARGHGQSNLGDGWIMYASIKYAYESGADVISCAWGVGDYDADLSYVADILEQASILGRNGKGCPIIFAAGRVPYEVGWTPHDWPPDFPANQPFVLSVGSVNLDDQLFVYSPAGRTLEELDVVAPSSGLDFTGSLWTLDDMGDLGWNPLTYEASAWDCKLPGKDHPKDRDYNCHFGGTSASAAAVAGIASLLVAKKPELTAYEVYFIIKQSAKRSGLGPDGTFNMEPNRYFGFGRADAFRALLSISRGDCDNSGGIDIADLNPLVDRLFISFTPFFPSDLLGDASCDGQVDIADLTVLVDHLFITAKPITSPCFAY
ncbi:MAG: S8 family serine peptidase, partial [Fimbriimonadaceae bacterium]